MIRARSAAGAFLWFFVAYLLAVILFGAWVRITHSGAGCGSHWPTCHGEIIPIAPSTETIIEFTHRVTSGALGILGIFFIVLIARAVRWTAATKAAVGTLVLIVFEALIGAGIVLKELVASDDSVARAIVIAIHLVNTLFLTGTAVFAVYRTTMWQNDARGLSKKWTWLCTVGLFLMIATCMTGAVTALGDTLFPIAVTEGTTLFAQVKTELDPTNHFLVRLRIFHPIVATVTACFIAFVGFAIAASADRERISGLARFCGFIAIIQLVAGFVNIGLAAPGWMQIVHLLLAQVLWMFFVLLTVESRR